jgi:hypothetical protein
MVREKWTHSSNQSLAIDACSVGRSSVQGKHTLGILGFRHDAKMGEIIKDLLLIVEIAAEDEFWDHYCLHSALNDFIKLMTKCVYDRAPQC